MTRVVQRWSPGAGSLRECVEQVFGSASDLEVPASISGDRARYSLAVAAVPDGLQIPFAPPPDLIDQRTIARIAQAFDGVIRRYLAAKVFGCWWPYLGLDLAGVVRAIQVHAAVLRTRIGTQVAHGERDRPALLEAIRETDLLMVHLVDGRSLAEGLAR